MKFLNRLLCRLTRHYRVKHTADRWVLLHFHGWDHSLILVDSIPYSTPEHLRFIPPGFKPEQFHLPVKTK